MELLEPKPLRARFIKSKKQVQTRPKASGVNKSADDPEVDSESISEKLDILSNVEANDDAEGEADAGFGDSLGDDQMRSSLHDQHFFNFSEDADVFRGRERRFSLFSLTVALADVWLQRRGGPMEQQMKQGRVIMTCQMKLLDRYIDDFLFFRFGVRNRIPLQPMNPNSNLTLASPTPAAKLPPYRMFKGKENNRFLQGQEIGNANCNFDGISTHMNQAGMPSINGHRSFNFQQQPNDLLYGQFFSPQWFPHTSGAPNNGLGAISRNDGHQPGFYDDPAMFILAPGAFGGQELDQSQMGVFAHAPSM